MLTKGKVNMVQKRMTSSVHDLFLFQINLLANEHYLPYFIIARILYPLSITYNTVK